MNIADIVKARFLEAANTDDRLPRARLAPGTSSGFWPEYFPTREDKNGWGTLRLAEDREMRFRRIPPSAAAIHRHTEVMDWVRTILTDPEHRVLVWHWAFAGAREHWSFGRWCRNTGRVKRTALRRLERAFDLIAAEFRRKGLFPTLPDAKWVFQIEGENGTHFDIVGEESAGGKAVPQIRAWSDPGAPRSETILTPEAIAEFEKFLAKHNRGLRRRREVREAA
jgi:hypothetical protein